MRFFPPPDQSSPINFQCDCGLKGMTNVDDLHIFLLLWSPQLFTAWQKLFWEMQETRVKSNKAEKDEKFSKITSKHDLIEHRWRMEVLIFNLVIVYVFFFLHYSIKRRNEAQLHKNLEFHRVEYSTWECFSISKDLSTNWMQNSGCYSNDLYLCLYYHF